MPRLGDLHSPTSSEVFSVERIARENLARSSMRVCQLRHLCGGYCSFRRSGREEKRGATSFNVLRSRRESDHESCMKIATNSTKYKLHACQDFRQPHVSSCPRSKALLTSPNRCPNGTESTKCFFSFFETKKRPSLEKVNLGDIGAQQLSCPELGKDAYNFTTLLLRNVSLREDNSNHSAILELQFVMFYTEYCNAATWYVQPEC